MEALVGKIIQRPSPINYLEICFSLISLLEIFENFLLWVSLIGIFEMSVNRFKIPLLLGLFFRWRLFFWLNAEYNFF